LTIKATLNKGIPWPIPKRESATSRKPGKEEITLPYPTSDAVFIIARRDPSAPALRAALMLVFLDINFLPVTQAIMMATKRPITKAQIAITL
jgi:hypothetical protein